MTVKLMLKCLYLNIFCNHYDLSLHYVLTTLTVKFNIYNSMVWLSYLLVYNTLFIYIYINTFLIKINYDNKF